MHRRLLTNSAHWALIAHSLDLRVCYGKRRWKKLCWIFYGLGFFKTPTDSVISWSHSRHRVVGLKYSSKISVNSCPSTQLPQIEFFVFVTGDLYVNFTSYAKALTATTQSVFHSLASPDNRQFPPLPIFFSTLFFCYLELILKSSWRNKWH